MKKVLAILAVMLFSVSSVFNICVNAAEQVVSKGASKAKDSGKAGSGIVKGSLTIEDKTIEMTNAYAFVDEKSKEKPVLLLFTDKTLPVERLKSESDLDALRRQKAFVYICFWLDKDKHDFRREHFIGKFPPVSTMGVFKLSLDQSPPRVFAGTVASKDGKQISFSVTLK